MGPELPRQINRNTGVRPAISRVRSEAGFTVIEVLAAALVVGLMAMGVLGGLDAMARQSGLLRTRADAQAIAQQSQNRLKAFNVDELSNLDRTYTVGPLDGVKFAVHETATYVSDSTGTPSCSNPVTDYLKTVSAVTWPNMGSRAPVTVTGVLTPPIAAINSSHGTLAVIVKGGAGQGIGGVTVTVSGPSSASGVTDTNGCVLLGDLPAGAYTISAYSPSGAYVDMPTGALVTPSSPDTQTASVVGGSSASVEFDMDVGGTINYSFAYTPGGPATPPVPGGMAVVAYNNLMHAPFFRMCTLNNGALCPAVGKSDTTFKVGDWTQVASTGTIPATPLFPFTGAYATWAGTCSANEPARFSGTDPTATLTPGGSANVTVPVPAMIIKVYSGTSTSPGNEVLPSHLYVKDTGCGVRYTGYLDNASPLPTGQQAYVAVNHLYANGTQNGVLMYPGMPYGTYNVCVDDNTSFWAATAVTNGGPGSRNLSIYMGATRSGLIASESGTC